MASMITHRVVGEIVFRRLGCLSPAHLGPFLLGNVLVDLHNWVKAERTDTHFSDGQAKEGPLAFDLSCANMLSKLDTLLVRPWEAQSGEERAFVGGYLCHLAADEEHRQFLIESTDRLGDGWLDLVPYSVVMTVCNVESLALSPDPQAADEALASAEVPDVFAHVDHAALLDMWENARPHVLDTGTVASFIDLLVRGGRPEEGIERQRQHHAEHWDEAVAFAREFFGGVEVCVEAMVGHALEVLPKLWSQNGHRTRN